jgi:hypothetical protein
MPRVIANAGELGSARAMLPTLDVVSCGLSTGVLRSAADHAHPAPVAALRLVCEKWVDDFKRDRDPDREIAIYETMARAYTGYCTRYPVTTDARIEVYRLVLARSAAPDDEVLRRVRLEVLSREQAEEVLRGYPAPPQPIEVGR